MRAGQDPLRNVPPQAIAVQEVVDAPECNVGVVGDPGLADDDEEIQGQGAGEKDQGRLDATAQGLHAPTLLHADSFNKPGPASVREGERGASHSGRHCRGQLLLLGSRALFFPIVHERFASLQARAGHSSSRVPHREPPLG